MSQSPTLSQTWSSFDVLQIITPSNDIVCAGITGKGLPCRWELTSEPKRDARQLLDSMCAKSPLDALDDLPRLARLCLCVAHHQYQAGRVVDEWTVVIRSYAASITTSPISYGGVSSPGDIPGHHQFGRVA